MFKVLTDFEISLISGATAIIADLGWLVCDIIHHGRWDHFVTFVGLSSALYLAYRAYKRHAKTGKKMVRSQAEFEKRIEMYLHRRQLDHLDMRIKHGRRRK